MSPPSPMANDPDHSGASQSGASTPVGRPAASPELGSSDNPMVVLISGILLLGGIAAFISWGLSHAYPGR
jgi:hypothetical protein